MNQDLHSVGTTSTTAHIFHPNTEEDITKVWQQCHDHLVPLEAALSTDKNATRVKVFAHIRLAGKFWFELAPITYDRMTSRFTFSAEDRLAVLAGRSDLLHLPVDAVNARLWSTTPTMLNIEPTTRCNFSCWYCVGREMRQDDIKVEDFERMLSNFPAVKTIALVGEGEPLMHKGFFEMARMAKDKGIRVIIISNGSAFSQSVIKQLCETEVAYVSISIDSFDADTFKSSRIDGDLEKVLTGIRRLRDYRDSNGYKFPKIALKGTLFSHTIDQLPKIVDMAKDSGVEIFESFQALNPMKNYIRIYPSAHIPELSSVEEVAKAINRDSVYAREKLQPMNDFLEENNIEFSHPIVTNPIKTNCDETWLYSLLSGDVTPCCQIKKPISPDWNLFSNSVESILANFEYENVRFNLWNGIFPSYCDGCWKTR